MAVGIRELKNRAAEIVRAVDQSGAAVVITRRGRPTALILPIDSPEAEDYALAHAAEILASLRQAEADHRAGRTVSVETYRRDRRI